VPVAFLGGCEIFFVPFAGVIMLFRGVFRHKLLLYSGALPKKDMLIFGLF
jgi:hypothetical protein